MGIHYNSHPLRRSLTAIAIYDTATSMANGNQVGSTNFKKNLYHEAAAAGDVAAQIWSLRS